MRQLKIDYRRPVPRPAKPAPITKLKTPRCQHHPGVQMVLAGTHPQWNTVRYLCPMCNAMGRPPIEVAIGVVSAYFPNKGYGFIDNGGPRIFFHISDLQPNCTPYVGMPVTCRVEENLQGLIGHQVAPR